MFVLVAGIENYKSFGVSNLPGARIDAERIADRWAKVRKSGGYAVDKASEPTVLIDQEVTRGRILAEMREIAKIARADDTFVLCLAGHGANFTPNMEKPKAGDPFDWYYVVPHVDKKTTVVPEDLRNAAKLKQAFVKDADLADILVRMKCQPIVLLDCCHSGTAVTKTLTVRNTSGRGLTQNGFGPVVISSCAVNQSAWESQELFGGGVFSYNVLQAMGPKFADADTNPKDNKLSVSEFFQFVGTGTERDAKKLMDDLGQEATQQPKIIPPADELKDLIIISQTAGKPKP